MYPTVNIDEEIVKLSTLSIGGRRMTKSVFTQILQSFPFDSRLNFVGDKVIGFVYDGKIRWLLYVWNDQVRKYPLTQLIEFSRISEYSDYFNFSNICAQLRIDMPEETSESRYLRDRFSEESLRSISEFTETASGFMKVLDGRQIFIAS